MTLASRSMHKVTVLLICLACGGLARRVQKSAGSKELAQLLLAIKPDAAASLLTGGLMQRFAPAPLASSKVAAARTLPLVLQEQESSASDLVVAGATLEQALDALPEGEKYNAVLVSLLSKREGGNSSQTAMELVREMSGKRLKLSPEAVKELVDTAIDSGEIEGILSSLSAARDNGACRTFATPQLRLQTKPSEAAFASLPKLPSDARGAEVGIAGVFLAAVAFLALDEVADSLDFLLPGVDVEAPPLPLIFGGFLAFWGLDRYALEGNNFQMLGTGLTRLFQRDLKRECAVESASFLLGYLLGLPCCPFTPTAFKPIEMLKQVRDRLEEGVGDQARLADRILIWLSSPIALESMKYGDLLQSDPDLTIKFLNAATRRQAEIGVDVMQGGWSPDENDERIRWAYSEARKLLQSYSGVREELQERMAAGVSVGECINVIEERLKNTWATI